MSDTAESSTLRSAALEKEKERLIQKWMHLQDLVDDYSEQVYHVGCEIEALNLQIKATLEEERRARARVATTVVSGMEKN